MLPSRRKTRDQLRSNDQGRSLCCLVGIAIARGGTGFDATALFRFRGPPNDVGRTRNSGGELPPAQTETEPLPRWVRLHDEIYHLKRDKRVDLRILRL